MPLPPISSFHYLHYVTRNSPSIYQVQSNFDLSLWSIDQTLIWRIQFMLQAIIYDCLSLFLSLIHEIWLSSYEVLFQSFACVVGMRFWNHVQIAWEPGQDFFRSFEEHHEFHCRFLGQHQCSILYFKEKRSLCVH